MFKNNFISTDISFHKIFFKNKKINLNSIIFLFSTTNIFSKVIWSISKENKIKQEFSKIEKKSILFISNKQKQ